MDQFSLQSLWRYATAFILGALLSYAFVSQLNFSQPVSAESSSLTGNVGNLSRDKVPVCQTSNCDLLKAINGVQDEVGRDTWTLGSLAKLVKDKCK